MARARNIPFLEIVSGLQGNLGLAHSTHAMQKELPSRFAFGISWGETVIQLAQYVVPRHEEAADVTQGLSFLCSQDDLVLVDAV